MNLNELRKPILRYFAPESVCCASELIQAEGARFDIERLGCIRTTNPENANVLFVPGFVSKRLVPLFEEAYEAMQTPKKVIALGTCACGKGLFESATLSFGIDIYVPGCPPRPEAIIEGLVQIKESYGLDT